MDHFILSHEGTYTVSKYLKVHCHYPNHISALRKAGLTLSNLLTIGDLWSRHNEKVDMKKQPDVNKKKTEMSTFVLPTHIIFLRLSKW